MLEQRVIHDALHYLGGKEDDRDAALLLERVLERYREVFLPRHVVAICRVKDREPSLTFDGCAVTLVGESIKRHFAGATEGIFSAFTLGVAFDRKVKELSLSRPSESVALNALGSAYAERKADEMLRAVRDKKEAEGFKTNFRFCPGYGDLPLSSNAQIAAALDATKKIGLTVTPEGLLLPIKSIVGVTACLPIN